jgi:hypothetical protein
VTSDGGDPTRDGALDVPTATVPTNRADRRRAYAAIGAVVLVVGAAIGLSALSGGSNAGADSTPRESAGPVAVATAAPIPGRPPASPQRPTVERLPDIANTALAGAGRVLLVARRGTAAAILAWSPGDAGVVLERTFHDAFSRDEGPQLTSLAPNGRSLIVMTIEDFRAAGRDRATVQDEQGRNVWDRVGVTGLSGAVWSSSSDRFVVTGDRGTWILARRDGDAVRDRTVAVADAPVMPTSLAAYDDRLQPVGFSEDGQWAFGAHYSAADGFGPPFIRASFASGAVQELDRLPPMTSGSALRAGSDGRSIGFVFNASTPGGPPSLAVREPDGTVAFRIETGRLLGSSFADDGRQVVVLSADGFAVAGRVRLVAYDRDGRPGARLLDVGPTTSAMLAGARDGFAAVVLSTTSPERAGQLIVVRLEDGQASAVRLSADDVSALVNSGWLPGP